MNSFDSDIQINYETEKNGFLLLLNTFVTRTVDGFFTSVYRKSFALSLPPQARSCHPPTQIFFLFVLLNRVIHACSGFRSLKSVIKYLKAIAIDRDYNPSIIDSVLHKLQQPSSPKSNCVILLS